jgi:hypothetical protein
MAPLKDLSGDALHAAIIYIPLPPNRITFDMFANPPLKPMVFLFAFIEWTPATILNGVPVLRTPISL